MRNSFTVFTSTTCSACRRRDGRHLQISSPRVALGYDCDYTAHEPRTLYLCGTNDANARIRRRCQRLATAARARRRQWCAACPTPDARRRHRAPRSSRADRSRFVAAAALSQRSEGTNRAPCVIGSHCRSAKWRSLLLSVQRC